MGDRVGLFDFEDYHDLVEVIGQALDLPAADVHERLFHEALCTGWNVSRAAREFGLVPHVYDAAMEAFYRETDAFVFELAVVHQNPYCQEIDRRIGQVVSGRMAAGPEVKVLALGDGIGTDALRFALDGCSVSYFEFEGYSSKVARMRFERAGAADRIVRLHALDAIPDAHFDVVINREVLEHVQDPRSVIENIWRYLRPGGLAVVTESFARVEPQFPTHLIENAPLAGRTPQLFVDAGFRVSRIFPDGRPMVFQKTTLTDHGRYDTLPGGRRAAIRRFVRRLADVKPSSRPA